MRFHPDDDALSEALLRCGRVGAHVEEAFEVAGQCHERPFDAHFGQSAQAEAPEPAQEKPWTQELWIYDLRTNLHFTLKENTLKRSDLDDFVACYVGGNAPGGRVPPSRHDRKESERFKAFTYEELTKRDKVNLDIFWLKDEVLEESANLPAPETIAQEITDDLEVALEQVATISEDMRPQEV